MNHLDEVHGADIVSGSGGNPTLQKEPLRATIDTSLGGYAIEHLVRWEKVDFWNVPVAITPNNFVFKSLSNWACNLGIGCLHACRFCYVPSAATIKQGPKLAMHGVADADLEWGQYMLLRRWDEKHFLRSLRAAERTPLGKLKPDGNRAIIFCSTTDPYQVIKHSDPTRQRELQEHLRFVVRRALELIRDHSSLRVRILTRSPLAKADFDLFKSFGKRLLFGMSLPTLRNDLARIYEPHAPAPSRRLETLRAARKVGLHVFVAMAPTYPECDENDLRGTLKAVAELKPVTIFAEPINIRAENVQRIEGHALKLGIRPLTDVFSSREAWQDYALNALWTAERLAKEFAFSDRLHLWPDKTLGAQSVVARQSNPRRFLNWLEECWSRISEWPR